MSKIYPLSKLNINLIHKVGGKNASLGEMLTHLSSSGIQVPDGFATDADLFNEYLVNNGIDARISELLSQLDEQNLEQLDSVSKEISELILTGDFSKEVEKSIADAYRELEQRFGTNCSVAVRSSATAEDLPNASFAGQQETFLNISGSSNVLHAIKRVFASLYTKRALSYRAHQGFLHSEVSISAGIQLMVRSDLAASGVMFSVDTETGFDQVVFITGSYGLGETVVQGAVSPDEFYVFKPSLAKGKDAIVRRTLGEKALKMEFAKESTGLDAVVTLDVPNADRNRFCIGDEDIQKLAEMAVKIEQHYQRPMDIEWAKDGITGELFIVQARPETVVSQQSKIVRYELTSHGEEITRGRSIGSKIGTGRAKILQSPDEMQLIKPGDVLVADMTDPDWEPIMKIASAIVTNRGGRTCHAAIIARELGIPAIVGTGDATDKIAADAEVTVNCSSGDTGVVYHGIGEYSVTEQETRLDRELPVKVMLNVANPDRAFGFAHLPHEGVGLARLEFIISQMIGIHPKALIEFSTLAEPEQAIILDKIKGYTSPCGYYVQKLAEGIATIASAFYPKPVIVRLSDFKSNEYAHLIMGKRYEPVEENPMMGFRGASRYLSEGFKACFQMECEAIRYVRENMGLDNVQVMIPFVRTVEEGQSVIELLAQNQLRRGHEGLKVIMMCELPSNAILSEQFLTHFDGFSIGSNDLTQLTLGLDRDSALVSESFDERDDAVKYLLQRAISTANRMGKYIGICGQGPSDHKDFAKWLIDMGIGSMSLNPDSVLSTREFLAKQTELDKETI